MLPTLALTFRVAGGAYGKNKTGAAKRQHPFPAMPCMKLMKTLLSQGGALSLALGYQRLVLPVNISRGREEVCTPTGEPELLLILVGST